jgi:hypothetical protein
MPRGPKGEKCPADVIGAAVTVGGIATGEIVDITTEDGKNAAAVALGAWDEDATARCGIGFRGSANRGLARP